MDKSAFIGGFMGSFAFFAFAAFLEKMYCRCNCEGSDEEHFWLNREFENSLEKADDLCEVGYTFQRNEIIYKKIGEKKWFVEILTPDDGQFETGCELQIENYIYKNNGKKSWTIERLD